MNLLLNSNKRRNDSLKFIITLLVLMMSLLTMATSSQAAIEVYEFNTPQQEAQYKGLIHEFRCPKCQNQNLAGSDSQIAQDLKRKTYEMVMAGQSDTQIREYMYERYGDFISYKPPVRPSTWILWYFPPVILITIIGWWLWRTKSRQKAKILTSTVSTESEPHLTEVPDESTTDIEDLDSNLSVEESARLKALLSHYDNSSHKD